MTRPRNWFGVVPLLVVVAGCSGPVSDAPPQTASTVSGGGLEIAPPPRELVFLEVTPAAARELQAHAAQVKVERWWLRYTMTPGGCSGLIQHLDLETSPPAASDFEFVADGIPCLLLKSQRHLLQGTRIDFGQKDGRSGFIVTSPHATERTKAAVAKWIADEFQKRDPDTSQSGDTK